MRLCFSKAGIALISALVLIGTTPWLAEAKTLTANCGRPGPGVQSKLDLANPGDTVVVNGVCTENVRMRTPDVTLEAAAPGDGITAVSSASCTVTVQTRNATIRGLAITGGFCGISVIRGGSAEITENTVTAAATSGGIIITQSSYGRIIDNTSSNNAGDGIFVRLSSGADIWGNRLNSNGDDGLAVLGSMVDVDGNEMKDNDDEGIEIITSRVNLSGDNSAGAFSRLPNTMTGNGQDTTSGGNGIRCVSYSAISVNGVTQDFGDNPTNSGGDFVGNLCFVFDPGDADLIIN